MALSAIFDYAAMRERLDAIEPGLFAYFQRARVDFCVISTATHEPVLAVEVDSHHHDRPERRGQDRLKDRIFSEGGLPLLRLRPFGPLAPTALRAQLAAAVTAAHVELGAW